MNPEAQEFLQSLDGIKLGVVAVCGKYRTGKSYLLNKLFVETYFQNLNNTQQTGSKTTKNKQKDEPTISEEQKNMTTNGFQVSPTINPCTKGLWIWKKVIYSEQNDCPMIVIDTEGLGAFDEDENHDAKIFLLALLLSSLIIYNSVGTIDETALNNLSLVINLSKKIQLRNRQETPEDIDELASFFPSFLWVLRDFTLKLTDAEGNRISSRQYLENALKEQKGCSESVEQKNRIRRLLKHFFQERDCCTLIRPTEKEKDLQDLARMKDGSLRKEFTEQMGKLKHKVMTKVKPKVMKGHQLNGPMILELANSYIEALNTGEVPNIENAWSNVCSFEQERAYKDSLKFFDQEIKERIKNSFQDIGSENVKSIIKQIRKEALQHLKDKILGDPKSSETFEKKLKLEIKALTKLAVKETYQRIDEQIKTCVEKTFQESIESKVRRETPELDNLDKLNSEINHILTVIQVKFVNDSERVEHIYRKYVQTKLFKVMEILNENAKRQQQAQVRLLQEKLKINEETVQRQKEEKQGWIQENLNLKDKEENEKNEIIKKKKVMEHKMKSMEGQVQEMQSKLKIYSEKEFRDQDVQTQNIIEVDQYIQTMVELNPEEGYLNRSVNTSFSNINDDTFQCQNQMQAPNFNHQYEQNKQLHSDILDALKDQSRQISKSMSEEFGQILKNNQSLSSSIEQSQKRCLFLEKKLDKKRKYEELVKNCQRLQCNGCNKLYTPLLFVSHFILCKKQQQLKASLVNENQTQMIQEEDKDDTVLEEQFLAKIVDMKQIYIDLRDGCISDDACGIEMSSNSDELVTIMGANKPMQQNPNQYGTVQFKFCVLFRGNIWYVNRTLQQIKNVMNKIQRDKDNSESEQCQIAKWLLEIERNEIEENYQRIAEIIETFFSMLNRKIFDNQLQMGCAKIQVEDVDEKRHKYAFLQEFKEFFEISQNLEKQWNSDQEQQNNDDEDIVQMTYDENDDLKTDSELNTFGNGISSARGVTIQSAISELYGGQRPKGFGLTASGGNCANHSTIHLDGEKSVNENSSLHFVSFFSGAEEYMMKKHLLLGVAGISQQTENEEEMAKDENYGNRSPDNNPRQGMKPFESISNRPSHTGQVIPFNCNKPSPFDLKNNNFLRKSQSPYTSKAMTSAGKQSTKKAGMKGKNNATTAKKNKNGIVYTE